MHAAARGFIARIVPQIPPRQKVLEVGSRNINGSVRDLIERPDNEYLGIDLSPGPGVNLVADAMTFNGAQQYDTVVCCEVLEHVADQSAFVAKLAQFLRPTGVLLLTAAGRGREPHSAVDGGKPRPGEPYANVEADDLRTWVADAGLMVLVLSENDRDKDVYLMAQRPSVLEEVVENPHV